MAVEVLCIVLTLTKHVIRRLRDYLGARVSRSRANNKNDDGGNVI